MRIHAHTMPASEVGCWLVFHVPTCTRLKNVLWVDDELAQWCEIWQSGCRLGETIHQAKKITINLQALTALVDPIDDPDEVTTTKTEEELHV